MLYYILIVTHIYIHIYLFIYSFLYVFIYLWLNVGLGRSFFRMFWNPRCFFCCVFAASHIPPACISWTRKNDDQLQHMHACHARCSCHSHRKKTWRLQNSPVQLYAPPTCRPRSCVCWPCVVRINCCASCWPLSWLPWAHTAFRYTCGGICWSWTRVCMPYAAALSDDTMHINVLLCISVATALSLLLLSCVSIPVLQILFAATIYVSICFICVQWQHVYGDRTAGHLIVLVLLVADEDMILCLLQGQLHSLLQTMTRGDSGVIRLEMARCMTSTTCRW